MAVSLGAQSILCNLQDFFRNGNFLKFSSLRKIDRGEILEKNPSTKIRRTVPRIRGIRELEAGEHVARGSGTPPHGTRRIAKKKKRKKQGEEERG